VNRSVLAQRRDRDEIWTAEVLRGCLMAGVQPAHHSSRCRRLPVPSAEAVDRLIRTSRGCLLASRSEVLSAVLNCRTHLHVVIDALERFPASPAGLCCIGEPLPTAE